MLERRLPKFIFSSAVLSLSAIRMKSPFLLMRRLEHGSEIRGRTIRWRKRLVLRRLRECVFQSSRTLRRDNNTKSLPALSLACAWKPLKVCSFPDNFVADHRLLTRKIKKNIYILLRQDTGLWARTNQTVSFSLCAIQLNEMSLGRSYFPIPIAFLDTFHNQPGVPQM